MFGDAGFLVKEVVQIQPEAAVKFEDGSRAGDSFLGVQRASGGALSRGGNLREGRLRCERPDHQEN